MSNPSGMIARQSIRRRYGSNEKRRKSRRKTGLRNDASATRKPGQGGKSARKDAGRKMSGCARNSDSWMNSEIASVENGTNAGEGKTESGTVTGRIGSAAGVELETGIGKESVIVIVIVTATARLLTVMIVVYPRDIATRAEIGLLLPKRLRQRLSLLWRRRVWKKRRWNCY